MPEFRKASSRNRRSSNGNSNSVLVNVPGTGLEGHLGSVDVIGVGTHDGQRFLGVAVAEPNAMLNAMAPDAHLHPLRQRIDHRRADAMQATGHLIRVLIELAAGMQSSEHDLSGRNTLLQVDVRRDASPIVANCDAAVTVQGQFDLGCVTCLDLVHRVIDDFECHVMQAGTIIGIADIHSWAAPDGIQSFQDGDRRRIVRISVFRSRIGGCSGVV